MFILYGELVCESERTAAVKQEVAKKRKEKIRDRWTERIKEKKLSKKGANG